MSNQEIQSSLVSTNLIYTETQQPAPTTSSQENVLLHLLQEATASQATLSPEDHVHTFQQLTKSQSYKISHLAKNTLNLNSPPQFDVSAEQHALAELNLTPEQIQTFEKLIPMVKPSEFAKMLNPITQSIKRLAEENKATEEMEECEEPEEKSSFEQIEEQAKQALLNTLLNVALCYPNKTGTVIYGKKEHQSSNDKTSPISAYPFTITPDNQLLISMDVLARGGFKKVSYEINMTTGDSSVKVTIRSPHHIKAFLKETQIHQQLAKNNPDIYPPNYFYPEAYETTKEDKLIYHDHRITGDAERLNPENFSSILNASQCCLRGLATMHNEGYVHLDIKPANLFVTEPETGTVKIADFGYARTTGSSFNGGSMFAAPPEALTKRQKGEASDGTPAYDAYSAGITLMELITGSTFTAQCIQTYRELWVAKALEITPDLKNHPIIQISENDFNYLLEIVQEFKDEKIAIPLEEQAIREDSSGADLTERKANLEERKANLEERKARQAAKQEDMTEDFLAFAEALENYIPVFGALTPDQQEEFFTTQKEQILNAPISSEEKAQKEAYLETTKGLLSADPAIRLTCQEAYERLAHIK